MINAKRFVVVLTLLSCAISAKAFIPVLLSAAVESEAAIALVRVAGAAFSFKRVEDFLMAGMAVGGAYVAATFDFDKLGVVNSDAATNPKAAVTIDPSYSRSRENPDTGAWDPSGRDYTPKSGFSLSDLERYPKQSGVAICTIVSKAVGKAYDTYALAPVTSTKVTYFATTTNTNPGGYVTAGSYTCGGFYYLWSKSVSIPTPTCPAGYTQSNITCTLVDSSAVRKPAETLPCEVIATAEGFQIDAKNPACTDLASRLGVVNGSLVYQSASGVKTTMTTTGDGAGTIKRAAPTATVTIPYAPSSSVPGAYTAGGTVAVDPGTSAVISVPGSGSVSDSGSGATSGSGSGAASWLCGLSGLPPCAVAVDSTGVQTTVDAMADPTSSVQANEKSLTDGLSHPETLWPSLPTINWTFALPTSCAPIPADAFAPFLTSIDLCQFQPMFHSIMSIVWVLGGLFGSIGLFWRNVMATN